MELEDEMIELKEVEDVSWVELSIGLNFTVALAFENMPTIARKRIIARVVRTARDRVNSLNSL